MTTKFNQQIKTYWWNMGSKKNDFSGNVSGFFEAHNIKVSTVNHPKQPDIKGLRFKFNLGSSIFNVASFDYANDAALTIVKLYLTYLGDRAQIVTGSRTININH